VAGQLTNTPVAEELLGLASEYEAQANALLGEQQMQAGDGSGDDDSRCSQQQS
jgi:hypothetical protein